MIGQQPQAQAQAPQAPAQSLPQMPQVPGTSFLPNGGIYGSGPAIDPNAVAERQRALLGAWGQYVPQNGPLNNADIPFLEFGVNAGITDWANQGRAQAAGRVNSAAQAAGQNSPENTVARVFAANRLENGPLNQGLIDRGAGALQSQGALSAQNTQQQLAQQLGAAGLGGASPAYQLAAMQQQQATELSGALQGYRLQGAQALDQQQSGALNDYNQTLNSQMQRQAALEGILNQLLSSMQGYDASSLTIPVQRGALAAGVPAGYG